MCSCNRVLVVHQNDQNVLEGWLTPEAGGIAAFRVLALPTGQVMGSFLSFESRDTITTFTGGVCKCNQPAVALRGASVKKVQKRSVWPPGATMPWQ